jgi:two-component system, NarL family, invasion response regulator UvrY
MTMRVLIADASPLLSEKLASVLSELEGLKIVGQAQTMEDALSAIRELRPDVVLVDVHLLGKTGLEVLGTLKKEGDAPFVMMLANDVSRPYQKQCLDAGADFLLYKSADLGKALSILKYLLPRYRRAPTPKEPPEGV